MVILEGTPVPRLHWSRGKPQMRMYFGLLAVVGVFAFLLLFLADRERKAGVERLSNYKTVPHTALEADPDPSAAK
jgi:hypothetical protein